jgi:hypothetical protein
MVKLKNHRKKFGDFFQGILGVTPFALCQPSQAEIATATTLVALSRTPVGPAWGPWRGLIAPGVGFNWEASDDFTNFSIFKFIRASQKEMKKVVILPWFYHDVVINGLFFCGCEILHRDAWNMLDDHPSQEMPLFFWCRFWSMKWDIL